MAVLVAKWVEQQLQYTKGFLMGFSFTLAWGRGKTRNTSSKRLTHTKAASVSFSAWRVHSTPWEVKMYVKATAKYTRMLVGP